MRKSEKIILLFFIIAFLGITTRSTFIILKEIKDSEIRISQLKEHLNKLRDENVKLREEIYRLKYDNNYIEILVREELGWIRPGEILCIPVQNQ
ncbi:MAG: septum formation initiator family protein [Dictyoglomi bacterium]|nr:septum formation initiator family protein [Dictyoglomota bacterium]HHV82002.1 septum formation initiator family protein [bacterium]